MTPLIFTWVTLAGGLGATVRMLLDGVLKAAWGLRFPWATAFINLSGSFVLGLLTGLVTGQLVDAQWQSVLGTGFLGGYTTFSTASLETVRLLQAQQHGAALFNALGVLIVCVLAAALGLWLGTAL